MKSNESGVFRPIKIALSPSSDAEVANSFDRNIKKCSEVLLNNLGYNEKFLKNVFWPIQKVSALGISILSFFLTSILDNLSSILVKRFS